jgi:hypothetical protein
MRAWRAFLGSLILGFLLLSAVADRIGLDGLVTLWGVLDGNTQGSATGTVTDLHAGEWLSVATGPYGTTVTIDFRISLRETTAYEGDAAALKPGARVTIWYRNIGERYLVADRVRVLTSARAFRRHGTLPRPHGRDEPDYAFHVRQAT